MTRYLVARYDGSFDLYYRKGQRYPLAIKTRLFRKKVTIYKTRGYFNQMEEGTQRDYRDMQTFLTMFKPVPQNKEVQDEE